MFDNSQFGDTSGLGNFSYMNPDYLNQGLQAPTQNNFLQSLLGKANGLGKGITENSSALGLGVGALQGLAGAWNTWNTNKAQADALNFQKQQYATNLGLTKQTTNNALSDRQERRVSANPNAESVDSYMKKWGV